MNLLENHKKQFQRNLRCAIMLYGSLGLLATGWGFTTMRTLGHEVSILERHIQDIKNGLAEQSYITIKKKDTQTMEDVKHYLTQLFAVPLPGISFSVLSLDDEGMRVRGNARSTESFETWLGHVAEAFIIDTHTSQAKSGKGLMFEVLLHEKP